MKQLMLVATFLVCSCHPVKPAVTPNVPVCYLAPGSYHVVARLMVVNGCPADKIPTISVQSMDVAPGQLKCGLVTAPLASGAVMLMKVKTNMIIGRLVVSDGKCHIEYGIVALPKGEKQDKR
jgi:hypothetical protein